MIREIVHIDEEKCNGCGLCVPACREGAIRIVNGKAKLTADNLCDGLGACLGHCPQGAIRIEKRDAAEFDEQAVQRHLAGAGVRQAVARGEANRPAATVTHPRENRATGGVGPMQAGCPSAGGIAMTPAYSGCPSARFNRLGPHDDGSGLDRAADTSEEDRSSELRQWPVQLRLLPAAAPMLRGAHLLICADCVPVAYAEFHRKMLRGRAVVIACPKLDNPEGYVQKLAEMMRNSDLSGVTVAHMEVPCCTGILRMAIEARRLSGANLPVHDIVISTRGDILGEQVV